MDIIKELWYGNVAPFEQCTRGDKQMKELLSLMARNHDELDEGLTEKQKETLEKFEEALNEMHSIAERDAFSYGLRLGIPWTLENASSPLRTSAGAHSESTWRDDSDIFPMPSPPTKPPRSFAESSRSTTSRQRSKFIF